MSTVVVDDRSRLLEIHVEATTRLLLDRWQLPAGSYTQSFQSLFGRDEWLRPYTEDVLRDLAKRGVKRVFVATMQAADVRTASADEPKGAADAARRSRDRFGSVGPEPGDERRVLAVDHDLPEDAGHAAKF